MRTQQLDIYTLEVDLSRGRTFPSVGELRVFVDGLRDTWWWENRYARIARVEVGPAARPHAAVGWFDAKRGAGRIEVPPGMRDELTVTHELAHVMAQAYHGSTAHDPAFAREYANLTYLIMGPDAWLRLKSAFDAYGVEY